MRRLVAALVVLAARSPHAGAQTNDHLFRSWAWSADAAAPRALGLAGASTAGAPDVGAALHNPALLGGLTKSEAAVGLLSRRPGDAPPGDAVVERTGIGFAGLAVRTGPSLVFAGTFAETHARQVRLGADVPGGVPETGTLEAVVTDFGLSAAWRVAPRLHVGGRVARSRLVLDGRYSREPATGPVDLRVETAADVTRTSTAAGVVVEPLRRVSLAASATGGVRWRGTRTAVSPLLGAVLDPGSGFDVRRPAVVSLAASVEPTRKVRVSAQVDHVGYGAIASSLVIGQGAHRREDYEVEDAWEPRVAAELSLPRRSSSLQLRAGVHWRASGALRYQGADDLERGEFPGRPRSLTAAGGVSLVTRRSIRVDVAASVARERTHVAVGLSGRF
jgi:long-subunit fatty acid transport protein